MLPLRRLVLLSALLLLQSCHQQNEINEDETVINKKADFSRAASYNVQLGLGYLKQGDRSRAKKKLLTAMKQEPQSPDVNAALGYYYEQSSEIDEARKYYLKAISYSGNSGAQLNNYGTFLCRQGDYKNAESFFLKAVNDMQYVNTAAAYENAGLCAMAVPDINKAKLYFIHALKHDPARRESLLELVKIDLKLGLKEDALRQLQKYPEMVISDTELLGLAKETALKLGNTSLASQYDSYYKSISLKSDQSGVDDEYSSHNG